MALAHNIVYERRDTSLFAGTTTQYFREFYISRDLDRPIGLLQVGTADVANPLVPSHNNMLCLFVSCAVYRFFPDRWHAWCTCISFLGQVSSTKITLCSGECCWCYVLLFCEYCFTERATSLKTMLYINSFVLQFTGPVFSNRRIGGVDNR